MTADVPPPAPSSQTIAADVLIIGAGPAGAAAAYHAARAGWDTLVLDMADVASGRDKTCGDGLTPRAIAELEHMNALHLLQGAPHIRGLKLHGFNGSVTAAWPKHQAFPQRGSAIARTSLDSALLTLAIQAGATFLPFVKATSAITPAVGRVSGVNAFLTADCDLGPKGSQLHIDCAYLILAEGVRSGVARSLGVHWEKGLVHGVAARSYVDTPRSEEPWIHSHLELRDSSGVAQPGYGWVFPLGNGQANLGCGALATAHRPARVNTKKLLTEYAQQVRSEWTMSGEPQRVTSALLPMGGAVTRTAGVNWAAIGDTAALVNPLNGEGIDYGMESARLLVALLGRPGSGLSSGARLHSGDGLRYLWPSTLREHYGDAFSLARRLATLLTMPGLLSAIGPLGLRGPLAGSVMGAAARLMGNLVTPEDRDLTARAWLGLGRLSRAADAAFWADSRPLFGR